LANGSRTDWDGGSKTPTLEGPTGTRVCSTTGKSFTEKQDGNRWGGGQRGWDAVKEGTADGLKYKIWGFAKEKEGILLSDAYRRNFGV